MALRLKHENDYMGHIFPIDAPPRHLAYVAAMRINPLVPITISIGDLSIDWRETIPVEAFTGGHFVSVSVLAGKIEERTGVAIILDCRQEIILLGADPLWVQAAIVGDWWLRQYPDTKPVGTVGVDSASIRVEIEAERARLQANVFTIDGDGEYPIYATIIDGVGHGFFVDFDGLD